MSPIQSETTLPQAASAPAVPTTSCPTCRTIAYIGDRFCACCGTRLVESCSECGSSRSHPVANYCTYCGSEFTTYDLARPVRRKFTGKPEADPSGAPVIRELPPLDAGKNLEATLYR